MSAGITLVAERLSREGALASGTAFSPTTTCNAGTLCVVMVGGGGTTSAIVSTISDNAGGNTWVVQSANAAAGTKAVSICYSFLKTAITTSNTFTITVATGNIQHVWIEEFSGVTSINSTDSVVAGFSGGPNLDMSTTYGATKCPNSLVIAAYEINSTARTFTKDANFSLFASNALGASKEMFAQYRIINGGAVASGTTLSALFSGGTNVVWSGALVVWNGYQPRPAATNFGSHIAF